MWSDGGPIDPSPTIDQAINGGYPRLEIKCSRCKTPRDIDLCALPTCRRHACTISPGGWFVRSARRSGNAPLPRCSSLRLARASRRWKTKPKTEIRLPLLPQQRTCADCIGRSVLCHFQTHAPQQIDPLFDHLVRAAEQRRRVSIPSALAVQRPTSVAAPTTP
jgi:hypothetical protein